MAEVSIQQAFEQVARLREAGRRAEADALYRHVVDQIPKDPNALHTLGVLLNRAGQNEFAADLFRRAIALMPDDAEFHESLGTALIAINRWDEAAASLARAAELGEPSGEGLLNLAHALRKTGRAAEAIARYRQAIALRPDLPSAHNNLGNLFRESGQLDEAIGSYRRAIESKPQYLEALNNLGNALLEADRPEEALSAFREALGIRSDAPELHQGVGRALRASGDVAGAIAAFEQSLAMRPHDADAHYALAQLLLLSGDFDRGWIEFEWRSLIRGAPPARPEFARRAPWRGEPLKGRRICLHADGTIADAIQFARFAPIVAGQGGRVILACPPPLRRLFASLAGVEALISTEDPPPPFDLHCPLSSLPAVFRTSGDHVPNYVPYLQPDPALVAQWRQTLNPPKDRLRIGLAPTGGGTQSLDLAPLLTSVNSIAVYNLQQREGVPRRPELQDVAAGLVDFADAAAVIANLDLVICADNAFAHLAGALAAPAWLLLPPAPDWPWGLDREDSAWYPAVRCLRLQRVGDGQGVLRRLASDLREVIAGCADELNLGDRASKNPPSGGFHAQDRI